MSCHFRDLVASLTHVRGAIAISTRPLPLPLGTVSAALRTYLEQCIFHFFYVLYFCVFRVQRLLINKLMPFTGGVHHHPRRHDGADVNQRSGRTAVDW